MIQSFAFFVDAIFFDFTWITHSDEELANKADNVACVALNEGFTVVEFTKGFASDGSCAGLPIADFNEAFTDGELNALTIVVTDGVVDADETCSIWPCLVAAGVVAAIAIGFRFVLHIGCATTVVVLGIRTTMGLEGVPTVTVLTVAGDFTGVTDIDTLTGVMGTGGVVITFGTTAVLMDVVGSAIAFVTVEAGAVIAVKFVFFPLCWASCRIVRIFCSMNSGNLNPVKSSNRKLPCA